MKQSTFLFFFLFGSFSLPLFCQINQFPTLAAKRDSALALELLKRAQSHLDTLQMQEALKTSQEAERILRIYLADNSSLLTDAYCLQGLALPRSERPAALVLGEKVQKLPTSSDPITHANACFFLGTCQLYSGQFAAAAERYQKALDIYQAQPGQPHTNVLRIYSNLGLMAANQEGGAEQAKDFYQKAMDFGLKYFGPLFPVLASPYNNRGLVYWEQGRYEEALADFNNALNIRVRTLSPGHPHIAATLNNLGLIAYEKGSLEQAHQYFLQALTMFKQAKDTFLESQTINNLGMVRFRQLEYADARRYFEQTLVTEQAQKPPNNEAVAVTLFNIGVSWREEGRFHTALNYFQRALDLVTSKHPQYAQILSSIGRCFEGIKRYEEALDQYEQAYTAQVSRYGEQHPFLANLHFNQANIATAQGDLSRALALNRKAQQTLGYEGDQKFDKVLLSFDLCTVLAQESRVLYMAAKPNDDQAGLQQALLSAQDALSAYQQFSRINRQPSERQVAKAAAFSTAEFAIATNHRLFQLTRDTAYWYEAFQHAEHSKAMLLLEAIQEAKILKNSRANPAFLLQEHQLREELAKLDILLQERLSQGINPTDSAIVHIALERSNRLGQYDTLVRKIAEGGDARRSLQTIAVKTVQDSLLKPGQTLLEYFVGDSTIFLFVVQPKFFEVLEIPKDFPLEQMVDSLTRLGIYGYHTLPLEKRTPDLETATVDNYTHASLRLYEKLIAPVKAKLTAELIIIPDGVLGYIPFEALLTKAPGRKGVFASYPFLLREHRISYC